MRDSNLREKLLNSSEWLNSTSAMNALKVGCTREVTHILIILWHVWLKGFGGEGI